jgi:hypothetical protein
MWILLWLQVVTADTIKYYHLGTYGSLEHCAQAKAKAMVMRTTKDTMVACLDVTVASK